MLVHTKWLETVAQVRSVPVAAVRGGMWQNAKAFSKAALSPSFPPLQMCANAADVRSASTD